MPGPPDSFFDRMVSRRRDAVPALPQSVAAAAGSAGPLGWRAAAAAVALAAAAVAPPVAAAALALANLLPQPQLTTGVLAALLVLAPGAICLATVLSGLRGLVLRLAPAGAEAELAVLRVLIAALLLGYTLALAAASPQRGGVAECLSITAAALLGAWLVLLCVIEWPIAPKLRRNGALACDLALFSAFLHFGDAAVAGFYPLYLLAILYAGYRFGLGAMLVSAGTGLFGFAVVIPSTAIWQQQPALAVGLLLAVAALPAGMAATIRALAAARARASGAEEERQTALRLIADVLHSSAASASSSGARPALDDILDLAALETGRLALPVESFEPRALLNRILVPLQEQATAKGIGLHWRVDARLPYRLRGHARALARILAGLTEHALGGAVAGMTIRLAIGAVPIAADRLQLSLRLDGSNAPADRRVPGDGGAPPLHFVERLVAAVGGAFVDRQDGSGSGLMVTLPLAIEGGTAERLLDLAQRKALVATEDERLAHELVEMLTAWNADPCRLEDVDAALNGPVGAADLQPVLIVDGRAKLLSALSLAHRTAQRGAAAPLVVLIAAESQIAGLAEIGEGGLDALIPAPVTEELFANALDGLPLQPRRARRVPPDSPPRRAAASAAAPGEAVAAGERVTPIATHPRFAAEATTLDARVIEGLRELGGGPGFLDELIETFRADSQRIVQRIAAAAGDADAAAFARGLVALQRAAGPLGGTQLCELAASLQLLTGGELRRHGAEQVHRIETQIEQLLAALVESVPSTQVRQG